MEPNIKQPVQPTTPKIQGPVAQSVQISHGNFFNKKKYILFAALTILVLLVVGLGAFYLGVIKQQPNTQKNITTTSKSVIPTTKSAQIFPTPISQTPAVYDMNGWASYSCPFGATSKITLKYPPNWHPWNECSDGSFEVGNINGPFGIEGPPTNYIGFSVNYVPVGKYLGGGLVSSGTTPEEITQANIDTAKPVNVCKILKTYSRIIGGKTAYEFIQTCSHMPGYSLGWGDWLVRIPQGFIEFNYDFVDYYQHPMQSNATDQDFNSLYPNSKELDAILNSVQFTN